ncbi:type I-E CRISPR-associated protein Cas6/Cse3/CasE [Heliomicrobium modesticaldum]|uniref:type I-E CRISPR-associated protein Cas6/Cse3/CasE n=1 Tax=Heliomicrobium modesticaldum TaxID=35701 RepID=UPI00059D1A17|nr:type I-E CRISPR-associated protein Cas6/Cse3/CasE [Heliomicrobium modesticaldum]
MYLSKLLLNIRHSQVRKDIARGHEMHRTLLRAFPEVQSGTESARSHYGVLYWLDTSGERDVTLLAQSRLPPTWEQLPSGYLTRPAAVKNIAPLFDSIQQGQVFRFRLRANPTLKRGGTSKEERQSGEPKRNSKRIFLVGQEAQAEWLMRQGEKYGFQTLVDHTGAPSIRIGASQSLLLGKGGKGQVIHVDYYGLLQVTDDERFRTALIEGIGPAKSYGCGMMMLLERR